MTTAATGHAYAEGRVAEGAVGTERSANRFRPSRTHFRLMGALLRSPEIHFAGAKNTPVLFLPLGATTPGRGTWFLSVRLWGTVAEELADVLVAGQILYVEGEMTWWKPPEGSRSKVYLDARTLRVVKGEYPLTPPDRRGQRRLQGGINEVWVSGYLASEVRHLRSEGGVEGVSFSVGVPGGGGFYNVSLWGEVVQAFLRLNPAQRDQILVRGFLHSKSYTAKDGKEVWALGVKGEEVYLLGFASPRRATPAGISAPTEYDLPHEEETPF